MRPEPIRLLAGLALFITACAATAQTAVPLFNGTNLTGWKSVSFGGEGEVSVEKGELRLPAGAAMTGVAYTNKFPSDRYELVVEAKKIDGNDFFATITFPVGTNFCSLVTGGWGGGVVGLSSVDGQDASENETTKYIKFEREQWYTFKIQVTPETISAWVDTNQVVKLPLANRKISLRRGAIDLCKPLGLASYQTTSSIRKIELRPLPEKQ